MEDLQLIFRSSASAPNEAQSYVVSLLNKFEVALTWDSRTLLIPSLLPTEEQTLSGLPGSDVRVKVRRSSSMWILLLSKHLALFLKRKIILIMKPRQIPVRSRGRALRPKKGSRRFNLDYSASRSTSVVRDSSVCRTEVECTG